MKSTLICKLILLFILLNSCRDTRVTEVSNLDNSLLNEDTTQFKKDNFISSHVLDTSRFELLEIDFDRDGDLDKIYNSLCCEGDSLYVYKNTGEKYELSLKTTNFTEDCIYVIDSIYSPVDTSLGDLGIYCYFNGSGGVKMDVYLKYLETNQWKLTYTYFETIEYSIENKCTIKKYKIRQSIILNDSTNWDSYRGLDQATEDEFSVDLIKR